MKQPESLNSTSADRPLTWAERNQRWLAIWFGTWALSMLALTASFIQYAWLSPVSVQAAAGSVTDELASAVIREGNLVREANGLADLAVDGRLTQAAQAKANDMLRRGYFAHYYQDSNPWQYIDATGYTDWHRAGENLAKNYQTAPSMVAAWLASPTHRANLLSADYTSTGVATATGLSSDGQTVTVTVQLFTGS